MNTKAKRLTLNRETVADLDRAQLAPAAAAASGRYTCISYTCYPGVCDFSGRNTCLTCALTCTTNFC